MLKIYYDSFECNDVKNDVCGLNCIGDGMT